MASLNTTATDGTGISNVNFATVTRGNPFDLHEFLGENLYIGICGLIGAGKCMNKYLCLCYLILTLAIYFCFRPL